jgi:hypothetical protein
MGLLKRPAAQAKAAHGKEPVPEPGMARAVAEPEA